MPIIKPPGDWSEETSGFYNGPPPTPGPYKGHVKALWLAKIKTGDNAGKDQIKVLVEIDHGKFKGAGIFANFNLLKQNAWSLNQFLESMTNGTDKQRVGIRKLFWTKGYEAAAEDDGKVGRPVTKIGGKFDPINKPVGFVTKMDGDRVVIDRFVVPLEDSGPEESASEPEASEDPLPDYAPDESASTDAVEDAVEETLPSETDDDDPWS